MIDANRGRLSGGKRLNAFQHYVLTKATTFEEFLRNCDDDIDDDDGRKHIFRNQVDYLRDGDGAIMVDFVGRFEHLARDIEAIAGRAGIQPARLPWLNATERRHYSSYYSPSLAALVAERYAADIDAFGYRFESAARVDRHEPKYDPRPNTG